MEESTRRPENPRRRRKTRMDIIKEVYLPYIFIGLTVLFVLVFLIGGAIRRSDTAETQPPETTVAPEPTEDIYAAEIDRLLEQAAQLAKGYDYEGAAALLGTFSGDITAYPALAAQQQEYLRQAANMVTWSDPAQVTALSFHTLIADPARAFTNQSYGSAYNKNFVTVEEFSKILQQLYDNGYMLVSLSDISSCEESDSGHTTCAPKELKLPLGKKPLLLIQTNANYYTYMVDGDGDGEADKLGAGFASKMIVDDRGNITCEMVDASGNTVTGNYDLVPILNDFIAGHPDFSYNGARAILAPSGYDGIFGYRIDATTKAKKGESYHAEQVAGAKKLVDALREQGYELGCYTYANNAYGTISAIEIQNDLQRWTAEITPVLGQTNILVYAQNSEIEQYSGSKFNVLQNAGFRYYFGFTTATSGGQTAADHFQLKRLPVTGSQMATTNLYSSLFDALSLLDPTRPAP